LFHGAPSPTSRVEIRTIGGQVWYDPKTAHTAAGDINYERAIPESCSLCLAREIALAEAQKAREEATR